MMSTADFQNLSEAAGEAAALRQAAADVNVMQQLQLLQT